LPVPHLFAGSGILFSVVLLTRMGRGEFIIVAATCGIAFLNWIFVRRRGDDHANRGSASVSR
jgi:hypothetical protein